jgi:HEAT repeat protein
LIKTLEDSDWTVCGVVAEALGLIGDERASDPLLDCLTKYYVGGNQFDIGGIHNLYDDVISNALIKIGTKATPALIKRLKHPILNVRIAVALILGRTKDNQAVPALIEAASDNTNQAQLRIVWAMGQIKDEACVPTIIRILNSEVNYHIKNECIQALSIIDGELAVQALIELLNDNSHEQSMAMKFPHTPDSDDDISQTRLRESTARFLGEMGSKTAIMPLCNVVLTSSLPIIVTTANDALCKLVVNDDIDMLINTMRQSRDQQLEADREELLSRVINSIGTPEALAAVEAWKQERDKWL